jgi:hypothetical protein
LRWSPSDFWGATTWEVADAYEGYAISKGIKKPSNLHDDDIAELKEMIKKHGKS